MISDVLKCHLSIGLSKVSKQQITVIKFLCLFGSHSTDCCDLQVSLKYPPSICFYNFKSQMICQAFILKKLLIYGFQLNCNFYQIQMKNQEESVQNNRVKIDLIVIGNPNSGKTSLIRRFIEGETAFSHFYNPTLGLSLQKKIIKIDNHQVTVCIWDTAGQQKFFSLTKNYFKKADGVLVVFDLTDKNSFERIQKFWMPEIKQKSDENCSLILIGNKVDMTNDRAVSLQTATSLAEELQISYFQTSAKTGEAVDESIRFLVQECVKNIKEDEKPGVQVNNTKKAQEGSRCFSVPKQFFQKLFGK